ncbi:MAG TPA: zinc ABC transporter substrate-binding protein [Melioribacteraceae bacterium]|nr:zinc ABC transporter substrate-binding protein [Melioribacteraceae bacterium]
MFKRLSLFSFVALVLFIGCNKQNNKPQNDKIKITVTITTYADFVKNIGGDKVEVNTMIPPNAEPHDYEPTPAQITQLSKSNLYFKIGSGFGFENALLERLQGNNNNLKIINTAKDIKIFNNDPHVWLGLNEVKIILKNIYTGLVEFSPKDSLYFKQNFTKYLNAVLDEEKKIKESFAKNNNSYVLVYHPAWFYFFSQFGITQLGIEKHGKEPNAQDLKEVINIAKKNNVKVVFIEPQFSKESALAIAKQLNGTIDVINNIPVNYLKNLETVRLKVSKSLQ